MQRRILVAAVVAVVVLSGVGATAAADATATQADVVTIELSVATPDGEPVGNAEAEITWDDGSKTRETRSNGRAFVDVPSGVDLEISPAHEEYVSNLPTTVDAVSAGQTVETTMYAPATAAVTITDADGPVENATVKLQKDGQPAVAVRGTTNADGVYESPDVESGEYDVLVRQPGYFHTSKSATLEGDTNATVEIERGEVNVDLHVQDPTPAGSGPVSADVEVRLGDERVVGATTDDQGRQSVVLDVNRDYDVTITKEGYTRSVAELRTSEADRQATFNITRTPSISLAAANEQVVVGEQLRVEVTDQYDRTVEGATVTVDGESAGETDEQGVASVEIPTDGDVEVAAEHDGLTAPTVTVTGVAAGNEGGSDGNGSDDGGTGSGSPGFDAVAAIVGALAAVALLSRRS